MPKRGWLGLAAVVVLAGSVWLWWLLAPHGGQIGGLGHVVPFTYPLMAAGLVMLVFSYGPWTRGEPAGRRSACTRRTAASGRPETPREWRRSPSRAASPAYAPHISRCAPASP